MSKKNIFATLAIITYNQEKYIKYAIEAALRQDYSNLEIIISDDCSSDDTYKIIQDVVILSYEKNIRIIKNENNMGIGQHINKIFSEARGDIVILAAGDDICADIRVSVIVDKWVEGDCKADCIFSDAAAIDEYNNVVGECNYNFDAKRSVEDVARYGVTVFGATAAWSKRLYQYNGPIPKEVVSEDSILALRAFLLGGIVHIPEKLVYYRRNVSTWINNKSSNINDIKSRGKRLASVVESNARHANNEIIGLNLNHLLSYNKKFREEMVLANNMYLDGEIFRVILGFIKGKMRARIFFVHFLYSKMPLLIKFIFLIKK